MVADDDAPIRNLLAKLLALQGFHVAAVSSAGQALRTLRRERFDLIIIDWVLEQESAGLEILQFLKARSRGTMVPVIMMSGIKMNPEDEAAATTSGAELFVTKSEILNGAAGQSAFFRRVRAILLRCAATRPAELLCYRLAQFKFTPAAARIVVGRKSISLNRKEADLFEIFMKRPNMFHSPHFLWEEVWKCPATAGWLHTLENRISTLRTKLGPRWGPRLLCHRNLGFLFDCGADAKEMGKICHLSSTGIASADLMP